jgi:hypothetical protein
LLIQAAASPNQAIFESLASEFTITLVAGSIALPNTIVADGQIIIREGPVYNTLTSGCELVSWYVVSSFGTNRPVFQGHDLEGFAAIQKPPL